MKIFTIALAALAMFTTGASAQVPVVVGPRNVKINKIQPAVVKTPEFSVNIANKRSESLSWFEFEVEFEVDGVEMVDELTLSYSVLFNNKLCVGEITHVNIPKGKDHYSVMYLSPRSLDRLTGGKQVNGGMLENIKVEIKKSGQLLTEKSMSPKPLPNVQQMPGLLVPKSETPFQVLWWDRYEAVKPGSK